MMVYVYSWKGSGGRPLCDTTSAKLTHRLSHVRFLLEQIPYLRIILVALASLEVIVVSE